MTTTAMKVGQKFTYVSMPVEITNFPAPGTQRFDVRVNGLLAGSIVALLSPDSNAKTGPWNVTGFRLDYPSKSVFTSARRAATAIAKRVRAVSSSA